MTGKSYGHRFFILVIVALAVAGCTPPIGTIGTALGSSIVNEPDGITVVAHANKTYSVGDWFERTSDHISDIYTTYRGARQQTISPASCDVWVIEDRGTSDEKRIEVKDGITFSKEGEKDVLVYYGNLQAGFKIGVAAAPGGGGNPVQTAPGVSVELW